MKILYTYMDYGIKKGENFSNVKKIFGNNKEIYKKIPNLLLSLGHKVCRISYDVNVDWDQFGYKKNSAAVLNNIRNTDVFIGEMTSPSQTLGFMLAYALQHGKPSLYFYLDGAVSKPAGPIFLNPSRLLSVKSYSSQNYKKVVECFLRKAKKQLCSDRTTFVSTRYINDYLTWKSHDSGLSKGEIIRSFLERGIEKDSEYENQ